MNESYRELVLQLFNLLLQSFQLLGLLLSLGGGTGAVGMLYEATQSILEFNYFPRQVIYLKGNKKSLFEATINIKCKERE